MWFQDEIGGKIGVIWIFADALLIKRVTALGGVRMATLGHPNHHGEACGSTAQQVPNASTGLQPGPNLEIAGNQDLLFFLCSFAPYPYPFVFFLDVF